MSDETGRDEALRDTRARKSDSRGPHFPKGVPILPGKWEPGVPIFMGVPKIL